MAQESLTADIETALRTAGDPRRAAGEKHYLKSDLEHLGVGVPGIRAIVKAACAARLPLDHDQLIGAVTALWREPLHEDRMAAIELLKAHQGTLAPGDIDLVERFVRDSRTWAYVDELAARIAGGLVERFPELAQTLDRWAVDDDVWLRRAALLALLVPLREGRGDFDRFGHYADQMLEERAFLIRKAIGWVLRDVSRQRPDLVFAWLEPRAARASRVTLTEAVKYLSSEQRVAITTARTAAAG
ncbi:MAG: DNA alkylation repair protein [Solirubrobacteraceae bacterium]